MTQTETIISIDPGTYESAYTIVRVSDQKPLEAKKTKNEKLLSLLRSSEFYETYNITYFVVEMIAGMGMRVGDETFETAFWIGIFWEAASTNPEVKPFLSKIYRRQEKSFLVGTQRCKDKDIIAALVDRYAPDEPNYGKGTAKCRGWFYGFKADIWQAYAVAVTFHYYYLTDRGVCERVAQEQKRIHDKSKRKSKTKRR
jgi:hypothetical protein